MPGVNGPGAKDKPPKPPKPPAPPKAPNLNPLPPGVGFKPPKPAKPKRPKKPKSLVVRKPKQLKPLKPAKPPAGGAGPKPLPLPKAPKPSLAPPPIRIKLAPTDPIAKAIHDQAVAAADPARAARKAALVLRRQRLLASLGLYHGAVDGVWGPQAQHAWSEYVSRRRNGKQLNAPFITPQQFATQQRQQERASHLAAVRRAAADSKLAPSGGRAAGPQGPDVRRQAQQQLAAEGRLDAARLQRLRVNPARAAALSLHQLAAIITDPRAGFSPLAAQDVKVVQSWLVSHGHPVALTGRWDRQTNQAFDAAYTQARVAEQAAAVRSIKTNFYGTGGLVPGTRPSWWTLPGAVPKPAELTSILQHGGFAADTLFRQLLEEGNLPHLEFASWRTQQLHNILGRLQGGLGARGFVSKSTHDGALLVQILSAAGTAISPRAQAQLDAQVHTLFDSRDINEFQHRIAAAVRTADILYTAEQARRAQHSTSWWGKLGHAALAPGKFARTAVVADIYMGADILTSFNTSLKSATQGHGFTHIGLQHPAADYWEGAQYGIAHSNTALRVAFEFTADPLVFVRPFRIGSTLIRYGLRSPLLRLETLGAYRLAGEGGALLARRVAYTPATWHLPIKAASGSLVRALPGMSKALALKDVAVDKAQSSVILAARNGFKGPRKAFATLAPVPQYRIGSDVGKLVDESRVRLAAAIPHRLGPVWKALTDAKASLYVDAHGITESSIGASLVARTAEEIRIQETHRLANAMARDVYERAISGGITHVEYSALLDRYGLQHGIDGGLISNGVGDRAAYQSRIPGFEKALAKARRDAPLNEETALARAADEWQRVHDGAGLFIEGAGDPEITHAVNKRVAALLDQFKEVVLPAIQQALLDHYEQAAIETWDEAGLWLGRDGSAAESLKAAGTDAFDLSNLVVVGNPLFGKELNFEQFLSASQSEMRRRTARLLGWVERQRAVGAGPDEETLNQMIASIQHDVEDSFAVGDFTPQLHIDEKMARRVMKALDVPENTPIHVKVERDSDFYGYYDKVSRDVTIVVDPDRMLARSLGDGAYRAADRARFGQTVLHELRHVFQHVHWPVDRFENVEGLGYLESAAEVDARAFAGTAVADAAKPADVALAQADRARINIHAERFVSIVNPRGGAYADKRQLLAVPELYARDHAPQARLQDLHGYREGDVTELAAPHAGTLASFSPFDRTIGSMVWDLGSFSSDSVITDAVKNDLVRSRGQEWQGFFDPAGAARRFPADLSTPAGEAEAEMRDAFRRAVQEHHVALAQAMDHALPYALNENRAFAVAFANAQSWPLRVAHNIISGGMDAWIFATLPLRPGWVVRNVVDNMNKTFVSGVRDPRAYMTPLAEGAVGQAVGHGARTIFEAGVGQAYEAARFLDGLFGTDVAPAFKAMMDTFWMHSTETLSRVFKMHGWNIPAEVLGKARFNPFERPIGPTRLTKTGLFDEEVEQLAPEYQDAYRRHVAAVEHGRLKSFRDGIWHVMANVPENYFKKVIYNDTMDKLVAEGLSPIAAHEQAWAKVDATLFDYSKISVVEDNLRIFFPFIQFWRKNTGFWARSFATKPWLSVQLNKYEQERNDAHKDWPEWMRRYVNVQEITDATAKVPGLGWLAEVPGLQDVQFDPLSFTSFGPYLRAFKSVNGNLPPDEQGMRFFGPFLDAMNDFGLSPSPFFRKPLESLHIASTRSWQRIFPQTSIAEALTRKFFGDHAAGEFADWNLFERVFTLWQGQTPSDELAQNFDFYVNREMVGQAARGEPVSRARAEATIRMFFLTQNVWGYFAGIYFRKNTPEDYYMAKLTDDLFTGVKDYKHLTPRERRLEDLWHKGGIDPATGRLRMDKLQFDRYVAVIPFITAYYKQGSYADAQDYLRQHPEITQYVDPLFTKGRAFSVNYVKSAAMYLKGAEFFDVEELMTKAKLSYPTRKAAAALLLTPQLKAYWAKNDTPAEKRHKMVQAEMHRHLAELSAHYFAIPESDHAARDGFLAEHPELAASWQHNNSRSDDLKAIHNNALADLRTAYFQIVEERGFAAAAELLHAYPFMFEGTSAAAKVDASGNWKPTTDKARAFRAAKSSLQHFFDLLNNVSKAAAYAWLDLNGPQQQLVKDYFKKYGKHHGKQSEKARDYLAAKSALDHYFNLRDHVSKQAAYDWLDKPGHDQSLVHAFFDKYAGPHDTTAHAADFLKNKKALTIYWNMAPADRGAFLRSNTPMARQLQAFFDKWANKGGTSEHARAWLAAKPYLDVYFGLPKAERRAWLAKSGHAQAIVLDFFKRFGKTAQFERAFRKQHPGLAITDPELRSRLDFWHALFNMTPDKRPAYILAQAEKHGVFVYGVLGDREWADREQKFIRAAMATTVGKGHMSERAAHYLYVKPLLDVLYSLPAADRDLFIHANPELSDYLDHFAKHTSITGNPKLDAKIEAYFKLDRASTARSDFLHKNPDVQAYFDKHSTPAERAIRNVVNVYFNLPHHDRPLFLESHPEISVYFNRKRLEASNLSHEMDAFDQADPRFRPYLDAGVHDLGGGGERMRRLLRQAHINRYTPDALDVRRERKPTKPSA